MKKRVVFFLRSKTFKKITIVLWGALFSLGLLGIFRPELFLKFGYLGVYIFNLFGPGTFLVPSLSRHMNVALLAFATAAGMATNDSVAFVVGRNGDVVFPRSKKIERVEKGLHRWGPWALFVWSLIPFPYDIIGVIAGYLEFTYRSYIIPTFLGKFVRFLLLGSGVVTFFGKAI
ncbi:hypothetical protein A2630_02370 [Candidatus Woesebacteria bacterium RIFCSPHIGHO2_01_FULL_44_10]|uniref:VTT domain-containing protein n=1 Tax=Candidatus Woesebacteria bacterium RIFCSPLOWO2_01_FULL_44_14 TaxID=1802525 RepID=A0A1F8C0R1_9BACT|nr:MAG: hypothetical protein A2630_02370 [Candidatus Woesebacteria bacterium RIFCSPHIGHO2_01_FULL_44_10]OGM53976.1 MAG: hypothetical protein A3F62_00195 [Candidatus Woesebacteria bacterium RIFCSPHIGHO2_12_FULL_44_11]OGM69944.1 MAG: hypothetical protein A2975_05030 [Candidatus Woesebacteria bacterium RIFCSPLOWO2_01_FULL_44_14]